MDGIAAEILGMTGISVERAADGGAAVARMKQPEYLSSALGLRRAHILLGNPLEKHGYLCWVDRSARRRKHWTRSDMAQTGLWHVIGRAGEYGQNCRVEQHGQNG